jgi:hypothetical protein
MQPRWLPYRRWVVCVSLSAVTVATADWTSVAVAAFPGANGLIAAELGFSS